MPINGGYSYHNHVVATPHGRTVGEAGSGSGALTDVVDTAESPGHLSATQYPPMTRGSIAGYTGFIPGQHQKVGLNYRSASDPYFTDLERQASTRGKDRAAGRVASAGGGQGINTRSATPVPPPAAAPTAAATSTTAPASTQPASTQQNADAGRIDNKYSRYAAPSSSSMVPISGYGGFVPLARTTQIGVGKPFQQFANEGFSKIHEVNRHPAQQSTVVA